MCAPMLLIAALCMPVVAQAQDKPASLTPEEKTQVEEIDKLARRATDLIDAKGLPPVERGRKEADVDCSFAVGFIPRAYENKVKGISYRDTLTSFFKESQEHPNAFWVVQIYVEQIYAVDRPQPDPSLLSQFKETCLLFY